jgi:hypothetical protein
MTLKIKEEGSKISFELDAYDIIHDMLSGDQRMLLLQSLSCSDEVIGNVCELIVDGYTYDGFSAAYFSTCDSTIQKVRKQVAENSDYSVKETIRILENRIKELEKDVEYWRKNYDTRHM